VKAAVRYNATGEFNQSPDNRRMGALPETMRAHIPGGSRLSGLPSAGNTKKGNGVKH
jgi:hypothetical protein